MPELPDYSEAVNIELKDGSTINMRRTDAGGVELCHEAACLELDNVAASEFLGIMEFFETLADTF